MFVRPGAMPLLVLFGLTVGTSGSSPAHSRPVASRGSELPASMAAPDPIRYATADSGNVGRYRVREELVGRSFPSDAIGSTGGITGAIAIGTDGKLITAESKFVVDVKPLKSDQSRRDRNVQTRILETDKYPTVTLVPTGITGIPVPLPRSGPVNFTLTGDLTVHGTTRPTTWQVTASLDGTQLSGTASTAFTFADFGLEQPRVAIVLTLADTIKLEYDFRLVRK